MRGVAGYMADLCGELNRITSVFKGGVVCIPGVPILLGGCDDSFVVRSILESSNWLRSLGGPILRDTWGIVSQEIASLGKGGLFFTEKFRHDMPQNLNDCQSICSWVSGGWTSPRGVQPSTPESEQRIVHTLIGELNGLYRLDLGTDPILDRLLPMAESSVTRRALVIGGSHAIKEANALADRGYEVITCAVAGWRPNKSAIEDMAEKVGEAVQHITKDDLVIVHCFDNVAFMSRSEEGGDLPIRKYDNKYHVEGDLVVTARDRLYMYFKNCMPIFKLLEDFYVIFLSPMHRYMFTSCCELEDHAPNRKEPEFESELMRCLAECRSNYKNFFFTAGFRKVTVLNPGLCVPKEDDNGSALWGTDPVHPLYEGYNRIVDLVCSEVEKLREKSRVQKREGGQLAPPPKRPRIEVQRPSWIAEATPVQPVQGLYRGGFGVPVRGQGVPRGRGRGQRFWRGNRGGY
jgi:hypothetical protein